MRGQTLRRKRWLLGVILGAGLVLVSSAASGLTLSLTPSATAGVGVAFGIDLSISGLGDGISDSLAAFTIKLSFDPALLTFEGADFGGDLGFPCAPGDPNPACEATVTATDATGTLTLVEVSFADLNPQPASFDLATLNFKGIVAGAGTIAVFTDAFTELVVTDLGLPETLSLASFDLPLPSSSVLITPEPSTVLLLACALALPLLLRPS